MESVVTVLLGISMVAVLAVLATGLAAFIAGGEFNRKYANKLMRLRVLTQAVAVALLLLLLLLRTFGPTGG
ncbi:MAG: twin transmembrane helix small protein [Rhodospirillaceae bacterium]|nr:twin transmembrane helix small protein [Rhodospirillaceae bacterium]